jgi:uncharacterized protein YjdB
MCPKVYKSSVPSRLNSFLLLSLAMTLAACGGSANMTSKSVSSIAVTPATASIVAGAQQQFAATASYSDGSTADVSSSATWTSSSTAAATISATGMASAVAAGSSTVTASLSGVNGTAALTVTAAAKTVKSIAVTPATASVTVGATEQFTATATYSDGSTANVSSTATWTSSSTATATINASGLAAAVAAGSSTVTATLSGVSGTATLTVTALVKTLVSIAVTPATVSVAAGATQQFAATATYSDGSTATITSTATWTSSSTATATISSAGLATAVAAGSTTVTATQSGISGTAALTVTAVTKTVKSIAVTPGTASFAMGATEQFTATATYTDGSTANITSSATWTIANTEVATISSSGLASAVASGATSVMAAQGGVSGNASFMVTIAPGTGVNVSMWHYDANRSGLNPSELSLTPSNVNPNSFGKLFSYLTDGYSYAEPLLMSNVTIQGAAHNVLYVATEHDSVYAFDADSYGNGTPLWQVSLLQNGETPMTDGPIQPYQGVTGTPVIDPSTGTLYVVSAQTVNGSSSFRLSALDITTGAQKFGGPVTITASVPGTNSDATANGGIDALNTSCVQRAALLLANGNVYIGFGGCHAGWLLSYYAGQGLAQTGKFDMSPNNNGEGPYASAGGVWMGAGGPVADSNGNIYITTGNGPFVPTAVPTSPPPTTAGAWADSVLKFSPTPSNGMLVLEDYFTPQDFAYMDCADSDLAAGGLMLIPGTTPGQLVAGGKMGKLYFTDSTNLGKENTGDSGAIQTLEWGAASTPGGTPLISSYTSPVCPYAPGNLTATINSFEIFGTSAYFNGSIYLGITPTGANIPSGIRQFTYNGQTWVPGTDTLQYTQENTRGTTPFISANGANDAILWMVDQGLPLQNTGTGGTTNATLRAYDAGDLSNELYNSQINASDIPGYGIKFTSPVVGNGKVYVTTGHDLTTVSNPHGEIDVYGLN